MNTLTLGDDRRRKMAALYPLTHGPAPERYRAIAIWWRLHAEESLIPSQALEYAENQERLYRDMLARPIHYRIKPNDITDYEWSQK